MQFLSQSLLLSLVPVAFAQYGPPVVQDSAPTSSGSPPAPTVIPTIPGVTAVMVGANNTLTFSPSVINATVGSAVAFYFYDPTHSIVQSSFDQPCVPLVNGTGISSGPFTTTTTGYNPNVFVVQINDTNPVWLYCAFPGHCLAGMAAVINPPANNNTLAVYQAAAANSGQATPSAPANVQGGLVEAAPTVSSTAAAKSGAKGLESGMNAQWVIMALTGMVALGVGRMII